MARRGSRRDDNNQSLQRDLTIPITRPLLLNNYNITNYYRPARRENEWVRTYIDRRLYKPDRSIRPPGPVKRIHAKLEAKNYGKVKFAVPKRIALCARREIRREVLFAKRKTGKGSKGRKHRNFWSGVSCK